MSSTFQLFGWKAGAGFLSFVFKGKLPVCLCLLSLCIGCSTEDANMVTLRQELMLDAEPSDATRIVVAKHTVADNSDVCIVGQVSGNEQEAFVQGQAAFLVTEVGSGEASHCKNENCKFCNSHKPSGPNAAVQFVGKSGNPLGVDARELFGIVPGDTVVIQGRGEFMQDVNMLQVTAEHIFVRPREEVTN